jgi:hypothetical protein
VRSVSARLIGGDANWLRLRWRIEGAGAVMVPPLAARGFADGLWRTTCFELFVRAEGGASRWSRTTTRSRNSSPIRSTR